MILKVISDVYTIGDQVACMQRVLQGCVQCWCLVCMCMYMRNMSIHKKGIKSIVEEGLMPWMFDHEGESNVKTLMQEKVNCIDGSASMQGVSLES